MAMPPGQYPGEERGTDTWRLMLAVSLMAGLWMLWPILFPAPPQPAQVPQDASQSADAASPGQPTPQAGSAPLAAAGSPSASGTAAHLPAAPAKPAETFIELGSEVARIKLSTWGGAITEFLLTDFEDEIKRKEGREAPPVDLVPGKGIDDRSFSLRSLGGTFELPPDAAYEVVEKGEDHVVLRHDTGRGVLVTRTFRFNGDSYAFEIENRFENTSDAVQSVTLEQSVTGRERAGEREGGGMFMPPVDQMGWACRTEELHDALSLQHEQDQSFRGTVHWAGINRQFFLAAMVPRQGQTAACSANRLGEDGIRVAIEYAPLTIPAGQTVTLLSSGFFGPKQVNRLENLEAHVDESIDFGWFGVISRPLLWLLVMFYDKVGNYGLAIVLLTLLVKLVLLPVTQKSFESAERMKKLQPLIKEMQAKYKNDRMMASQKQMELFKEHNVSPFGGCLPMLLQMPIWIALYRTLYTSVELYQQPFISGWIDNLAFKDPTYVLPVLVTVLMLVQQIFTPLPQDNPSMKYVMWGMPLMFGVIMLQLPAGLGLYIFANSVLTVAQQYYIKRKFRLQAAKA